MNPAAQQSVTQEKNSAGLFSCSSDSPAVCIQKVHGCCRCDGEYSAHNLVPPQPPPPESQDEACYMGSIALSPHTSEHLRGEWDVGKDGLCPEAVRFWINGLRPERHALIDCALHGGGVDWRIQFTRDAVHISFALDI